MDPQESQQKFHQADSLFKAGRYNEALAILDQLNRAFPNTKNILYPAALCLEKLGRSRDAINLCDQLISGHQDTRAQNIKNRLAASMQAPVEDTSLASLGMPGASDILDMGPPRSVPAYKPAETERDWKKYALIGLGVAALLAVLIIPPLMYEAPPDTGAASPAPRAPEAWTPEYIQQAIGVGEYILITIVGMLGYMVGGFVALLLMTKLPSDEFLDNFLSLGAIALGVTLLGFIPFVGPIIALVIIAKTYDLGCGGLFIFAMCAGFVAAITSVLAVFGVLAASGALPVG